MNLTNCIYYCCLLVIFHTQSIWTYQCLKCATQVYNHLATIAHLSSPTEDDCNIVTTIYGCYIHISWLADGTSEVHYNTDPDLPFDSIFAVIERQVTSDTNEYSTHRSIGYSCRSNRTPCNTIDTLKRVIISVTVPTDEQVQQFDTFIAPTKAFNGSECSRLSNIIDCPKPDFVNCRQCMSVVQYSEYLDICSTCSTKNVTRNFFIYQTTISINKISRSERIILGCQEHNTCNSIRNINQMKRVLTIELNSKEFYHSIASTTMTTKSNIIILSLLVLNRWCRLIEQYYS